ncbi:MAG: hypothetical protein WCC64_08240, partial [Aliidongia sp.]
GERHVAMRCLQHKLTPLWLLTSFAAGLSLCNITGAAPVEQQTPLHIIVFPLDGTVRAAYRLARPTTHFHFAQNLDAIRSRSWTMKTPGLTLDHDVVSAENGSAFREFTIAIKPDETASDRTYPALFRIGPDGLALYTPYLAGESAAYQSFVEPKLPANSLAFAGTERVIGAFGMLGVDRYVYLGPSDYIERGNATFIIPPDLPGWLGETAKMQLDRILTLYNMRLDTALPVAPTVLMAYAGMAEPSRYRGDVSAGSIIALRFRGDGWRERGAGDTYDIVHLIAHEAFHLWNGMLFHSREMGDQPWLHEGGAEYAALLALRILGEMSDEEFRDELEDRINRCRTDLATEPLTEAAVRRTSVTYDCGVVVQWIADAAARHNLDHPRDFFALWRGIFQNAALHHDLYDGADFAESAPPEARPAIASILTESGTERWAALPTRLKPFGIELAPPGDLATDDALRRRALQHLLIHACGTDRHGFATEPGFLQLDTGPGCGSLAGDPAIDSVEGHDLFRDMPGAFAAMVKKCGSSEPVILGGKATDRKFLVACPKPLSAEPRYVLGNSGVP